jgi:hypothetical protein
MGLFGWQWLPLLKDIMYQIINRSSQKEKAVIVNFGSGRVLVHVIE